MTAADLQQIHDRLSRLVVETTQIVLAHSSDRTSMEEAYNALEGRTDGLAGRRALRTALEADGLGSAAIDAVDAFYVACLLDATL